MTAVDFMWIARFGRRAVAVTTLLVAFGCGQSKPPADPTPPINPKPADAPLPTGPKDQGPSTNPSPPISDVDGLIAQLKSADMQNRVDAAAGLGKLGAAAKTAVPALLAATGDAEFTVQDAAVKALVAIGPDAVPTLRAEWPKAAATVRSHALDALARIGPPKDVVPILIDALKDADLQTRVIAVHRLGDAGDAAKDAVFPLVNALSDPEYRVSLSAVIALGRLGPVAKDAAPVLANRLKGRLPSGELTFYAESHWKVTGDASLVVPLLGDNLSAGEVTERMKTAELLGKIGPASTPAIPALVTALKDPEQVVRMEAAIALGAIGPKAKDAVPALLELHKKKDGIASGSAGSAVVKIDPDAAKAAGIK